jgi:hypothetical protein
MYLDKDSEDREINVSCFFFPYAIFLTGNWVFLLNISSLVLCLSQFAYEFLKIFLVLYISWLW